jgi:hypothetical protein
MTGDDDGERVAPERLPHGTSRPFRVELERELTVRTRRAGRDVARHVVHPAVKRRQRLHVELDLREVVGHAGQERVDAGDHPAYLGRWIRLACLWAMLQQSSSSGELPSFG